MEFYKCSKCGEVKPTTEFSRDRTKKTGHKSQCKVCEYNRPEKREYQKKYRTQNRDYFREKVKKYRKSEKGAAALKEAAKARREIIGKGDKTITLEAVFYRDGGRCRICGDMCDFEDTYLVNGTIATGGNYPSIDHKIPLKKQGAHTWDNVQLAHKRCNSKKHTE